LRETTPGKDDVLHLTSKWRPLPQFTKEDGHVYVTITDDEGNEFDAVLAKTVLMTFGVPRPSLDHGVYHRNGNPKDNSLENLEWRLPASVPPPEDDR
jgi:hypothetical protein